MSYETEISLLIDLNVVKFTEKELIVLKGTASPINANSGKESNTHLTYEEGAVVVVKMRSNQGTHFVLQTEDEIFIYPKGTKVKDFKEHIADIVWEVAEEFEAEDREDEE
jgi:hypothetical protein